MEHTEKWIWLLSDKYGTEPHNIYSALDNDDKESEFIVAEFLGNYEFSSRVVSASLRFSGDCVFQLYCNDKFIATVPACVGGDFIGNETWLARKNGAYKSVSTFDGRITPDEFSKAECFRNIWNTEDSHIPVREENVLFCENRAFDTLRKSYF